MHCILKSAILAAMFIPASINVSVAQSGGDIPDDIIREWIMANPQVIVDSLSRYENDRRLEEITATEMTVSSLREALRADAPVIGNPDGSFEIVMFSDYRCPHCRNTHAQLNEVIAEDADIRVVIREFPVLGEMSNMAARYALAIDAVGGQDAYEAVNNRIFAAGADMGEAWIKNDMTEAGFNPDEVIAAMSSEKTDRHLSTTLEYAQQIGVTGTPFLVVGDLPVPGGISADVFREIIAEYRDR